MNHSKATCQSIDGMILIECECGARLPGLDAFHQHRIDEILLGGPPEIEFLEPVMTFEGICDGCSKPLGLGTFVSICDKHGAKNYHQECNPEELKIKVHPDRKDLCHGCGEFLYNDERDIVWLGEGEAQRPYHATCIPQKCCDNPHSHTAGGRFCERPTLTKSEVGQCGLCGVYQSVIDSKDKMIAHLEQVIVEMGDGTLPEILKSLLISWYEQWDFGKPVEKDSWQLYWYIDEHLKDSDDE